LVIPAPITATFLIPIVNSFGLTAEIAENNNILGVILSPERAKNLKIPEFLSGNIETLRCLWQFRVT
jgi:hypothetical protein